MNHLDTISRIRGSLIGGAAGDALGYAIEFCRETEIFETYGPGGLRSYQLGSKIKKALISDDTQMTMFTANGILNGITQSRSDRCDDTVLEAVANAYLDWLRTQQYIPDGTTEKPSTWLSGVPDVYYRRAPGNTCMSALYTQQDGSVRADIAHPLNHSKGCGGVMRVAPMGLRRFAGSDTDTIDYYGAQAAAVTHGHPLGYLPAAVMTHIVHSIVYPRCELTLKETVIEAIDSVARLFSETDSVAELSSLLHTAVSLSENDDSDLANIHRLGEGWVGDEALAIAIYCALRYPDDFSAGIIAAANHNGDSDSTAAITGNILGARLGFDAIGEQWKTDLELFDVLLELADDLSKKLPVNEDGSISDRDWQRKYAEKL